MSDQISEDINVDELVTRYPETAGVFVRHRMNCVGCDVARFETLAEVCRIYRQPLDQILIEIRQAAARHAPRHDG
ncbi:MAG TPA: DUF1858 domain-containing protein [Chloroflexota bacterium]|nr:DUF1858 domain-containing protein [Chloroflexota bacterium]